MRRHNQGGTASDLAPGQGAGFLYFATSKAFPSGEGGLKGRMRERAIDAAKQIVVLTVLISHGFPAPAVPTLFVPSGHFPPYRGNRPSGEDDFGRVEYVPSTLFSIV